jgi:tRNA-modifying protein YgfZ
LMIIHAMTASAASTGSILQGVARLHHWGVIRVDGPDAATFLQGQLTQDVLQLSPQEWRLAAFCSAKGRMQASFLVLQPALDPTRQNAAEDTTESAPAAPIFLLCSRDILGATLKRLSMFVLRAKAKLSDATDVYSVFGLAGNAIDNIADCACPAGVSGTFDSKIMLFLADFGGVARALCLVPAGAPEPAGPALDEALWLWSEVQTGVATITTPIVDAFVPQMLNYESVGGVNFKKGCYPGQEVVARSQFRGTLKRRAYLVHSDGPVAAGDALFGPADAQQPCGTVAQAAPSPFGGFDAIVSMQVAVATAANTATAAGLPGGLTVGSPTGAALEIRALPYALLDDI